jgi:YbgC/YbaW family acyl-CoA thioester hydrolase
MTDERTTNHQPRTTNLYETRVRSHQTDLNGSMYHAAFFDIFDDARIDVFRSLGYSYDRAVEAGWRLIVRRVECEYYRPAQLDDELQITVEVEGIRPALLECRFECRHGGQLVARGHVAYAFLNERGRATRTPPDLRELIEQQASVLGYDPSSP